MNSTAYDIEEQHPLSVPDAGPLLGRYELIMRVASGGMATVWAARLRGTRGFEKIVALKTILPRFCADAKYERMFLDEATFAGQIRHPNVAQILDLGEDNGVLFLAMEWIDGVTVDDLLRQAHAHRTEIPLPVAIRIAIQAASGLHAAHELRDTDGELVGLVHGDVSPQNIIVSFDGVTKLVDFGIAKLTGDGPDDTTRSSLVQGKVAYLAPEQLQGEKIDRRADVFALGIILYFLTTGTHPFNGRTASATLYKISSPEPVKPPSELVPEYPSELEATVLRCLDKDPSRRFATSDELVWALESSIPSELRATDQDVAVLVRSLAGDLGARRLRELRSARADVNAATSRPSAGPPSRPTALRITRRAITLQNAPPPRPRPPQQAAARPSPESRERNVYRPLLLCAALVGSVGALTLESMFRVISPAPASAPAPPTLTYPRGQPERPPTIHKIELPKRRSSKPSATRGFARTTAVDRAESSATPAPAAGRQP